VTAGAQTPLQRLKAILVSKTSDGSVVVVRVI
jgi:hypothetical protein